MPYTTYSKVISIVPANLTIPDDVLFGAIEPNDVNRKDNHGQTRLHKAIRRGNSRWVRYLISNGANITIRDNTGLSPLDMAIAKGDHDIIRLCRQAA